MSSVIAVANIAGGTFKSTTAHSLAVASVEYGKKVLLIDLDPRAEDAGVYVVNKPQSLRDANEKLFTSWFSQCCAETLVSSRAVQIRQFLEEQQDIIIKPHGSRAGGRLHAAVGRRYFCERPGAGAGRGTCHQVPAAPLQHGAPDVHAGLQRRLCPRG